MDKQKAKAIAELRLSLLKAVDAGVKVHLTEIGHSHEAVIIFKDLKMKDLR